MLPQEDMIEKVGQLCDQEEQVVAALMYGSFALDQGDRLSDIEFYLFFAEEALEGLEEQAWVSQIAPLELYYVNEFGNGCAIFEDLCPGASSTSSPSRTWAWSTRGRPLGSRRWSRRCWRTRAANCLFGWAGWWAVRLTWVHLSRPCLCAAA